MCDSIKTYGTSRWCIFDILLFQLQVLKSNNQTKDHSWLESHIVLGIQRQGGITEIKTLAEPKILGQLLNQLLVVVFLKKLDSRLVDHLQLIA